MRIKGGFPDPDYITPFDSKEEADAYICTLDWEFGRSYAAIRVMEISDLEKDKDGNFPGTEIVEV